MSELKCPNCGAAFTIDESNYANILQQVRNEEFERELARRAQEIAKSKESEMAIMRAEQERIEQRKLAEKEAESSAKDKIIAELQAKLQATETEKKLAISEAVQNSERESSKRSQDALEQKNAELAACAKEIAELKAQLMSADAEKKLAVTEAKQAQERVISEKNNEILTLQGQLSIQSSETAMRINGIEQQHSAELKMKDEQIAYYRDFKARQSTKMIGESLEQHCMNTFNQIRMTAFPNAYFEKDNDARSGSKGDFIFRESQDGAEFLSIMFEMKNEGDETATKHKNEDFFKELDKDRREKGCEYAVLVTMLEADNEYYNTGIVDVSYRYPKMYVIRPQFFITLITLLRNAALNSLKYQQELQVIRTQQIDLTNFEANMQAFKDDFGRNYRIASERFATAIEEIDKTIDHLNKTKQALLSSDNNLRIANNKAEQLSVKRLTKNAPSIRKLIAEQSSLPEIT